jgi:hypothetical protein
MNVKVLPFTLPNFVIIKPKPRPRQEGFRGVATFPLSDVEAAELSRMCDEFRAGVFAKAKKKDPKRT